MKTETILASLGECDDDGLRAVQARCGEMLRQRDTDRKEQALSDARARLAAVGLSLKDLLKKPAFAKPKGPVYHVGRTYQHPANKTLTWPGKGKKPAWLVQLEAEGGHAVELAANDSTPMPVKKTA